MSLQRRISRNAALRDVRDDRAKIPAGLLAAKASVNLTVRLTRRPLIAAGKFDRSSIMHAAAKAARAHQERAVRLFLGRGHVGRAQSRLGRRQARPPHGRSLSAKLRRARSAA